VIGFLVPLVILVAASIAVVSSVSVHLFLIQCIWISIGVAIIVTFLFFDWREVFNYRWLIFGLYAIGILLLIYLHFKGPVVRGARSWVLLGPFSFQPVELVKVALIFIYAGYFSRRHIYIARWQNILTSFLFFAVPAVLVALQPNLGSAVILGSIWFGFLLFSGLPGRRLVVVLIIFAVLAAWGWSHALRDYQRARIVHLFYPKENVLGINYSVTQSKIAIGSAGMWGKGYKQGTQTQLGFLTEPESDFSLAVFIEEWGIALGIVLVAAFLALELWIVRVGIVADQNFEKFTCLGTATMFAVQFLLNAGSALGITPVVGLTFPFLSYGGSSLLASFFLLAIVNAIRRQSW
jgi:rod shape determining protein RodA